MYISKALERIQAVTHEKLEQYRTTPHNCNCVDFQRGGSLSSPDHRDCKHTIKLQSEISFFNTRRVGRNWVCGCVEWDQSGEGNQGSCLHTKAMQGWKTERGVMANV